MTDLWELCIIEDVDNRIRFYSPNYSYSYKINEYIQKEIDPSFKEKMIIKTKMNGIEFGDEHVVIIRKLLADGWEPFGTANYGPGRSVPVFRRKHQP